MLTNTFLHIPGVGEATEQLLWKNRILCWDDFLSQPNAQRLTGHKFGLICQYLQHSKRNQRNIQFFKTLLPGKRQWRLFGQFERQAVYLDIETTGLDRSRDDITVIGLYDGHRVQSFIQGVNLEQFESAIRDYQLIITYNGARFDLPIISAHFKSLRLYHAHIDLRFLWARLGYTGGLKRIEQRLGICRDGELQGLNGYDAVILWQRYLNGDKTALELLLRYNAADVVNLKTLMQIGYQQMRERYFPCE